MEVREQLKYLGALLKRKWFYVIIILLIALFSYPLPYYITQPGDARELEPIIKVENAYDVSGDFMLTTVLVGKSNLASLAIAKLNDYYHIYPETSFRYEGENEQEYNVRQLELMHSAKNTATVVAYEAADKEYEIENYGVLVTNLIDGMPAEDKLNAGDVILAVDSTQIQSIEQLNNKISTYKLNDQVTLTVKRESSEQKIKVRLTKFPDELLTEETKGAYGIGISNPVTIQEIYTNPKIEIDTNEIGGPSAGLMFSLEIFNQLTKQDYTKGYKIAGTGTINYKGNVGPIGGIKQKVVAADNAGADIFFAPVASKNYDDAKVAAEDIGTKMKIVPVKTFKDAITYLEKLAEK
jgi:Lon-like protease